MVQNYYNGNAYYRNVTTYQLENNDEIANILKKTIDDLNGKLSKSNGEFLLFVKYGYNAFLCCVMDADPKKI